MVFEQIGGRPPPLCLCVPLSYINGFSPFHIFILDTDVPTFQYGSKEMLLKILFKTDTDVAGNGLRRADIIFVKFFTPAQFQDFENLPEKSA